MDILLLLIGLTMLYYGSEFLVNSSVSISLVYKIPKLYISAIILSLATSAPELFLSMNSIYNKEYDIAIGNIVGSNIANILLVFGISLFLINFKPCFKNNKKHIYFLNIITIIFGFLLYYYKQINFIHGLILLSLMVYFIYLTLNNNNSDIENEINDFEIYKPTKTFILIISGFFILLAGSKITLLSALNIAEQFNLSSGVIGTIIIAVGTSIPEISACIVSALKKERDLIIGSILGSNIFNILLVAGMGGLYSTVSISYDDKVQMTILLMVTSTILFSLYLTKPILNKITSLILLLTYISFTYLILT